MTRIKSFFATLLIVAAGIAALGLGAMLAMTALVIGLVVALAARLAISASRSRAEADIADAEVTARAEPAAAAT